VICATLRFCCPPVPDQQRLVSGAGPSVATLLQDDPLFTTCGRAGGGNSFLADAISVGWSGGEHPASTHFHMRAGPPRALADLPYEMRGCGAPPSGFSLATLVGLLRSGLVLRRRHRFRRQFRSKLRSENRGGVPPGRHRRRRGCRRFFPGHSEY
jgi:hypothetical protein